MQMSLKAKPFEPGVAAPKKISSENPEDCGIEAEITEPIPRFEKISYTNEKVSERLPQIIRQKTKKHRAKEHLAVKAVTALRKAMLQNTRKDSPR